MIGVLVGVLILASYGFILIAIFFFLTGEFFGAPFVPTASSYLPEIVKKLHLKKGQTVYDLGSGNGKIVRFIAQRYPVKVVGIEINPLLVLGSRIMGKIQGLENSYFKRKNLFKEDLSGANVVFVFLLSKTLKKLKKKILKDCQRGTMVVSHGFKFPGMDKYLVDQIDREIFCTYYYKIS